MKKLKIFNFIGLFPFLKITPNDCVLLVPYRNVVVLNFQLPFLHKYLTNLAHIYYSKVMIIFHIIKVAQLQVNKILMRPFCRKQKSKTLSLTNAPICE